MAWARVQSKSATSPNAAPNVTLASTPVTGNKIVVSFSGSQSVTACKDGNGNALTLLASTTANSGQKTYLWAYDVPATASKAFNFTISSNVYGSAVVQEISGLIAGNTTAMLDGTPGTLNGTVVSGNITTGTPSYTSTAANEYLIAVMGDWGDNATAATPSGYTLDANSVNTSGNANCVVAYKNSTGGADGQGWTETNSGQDQWGIISGAIQLPAGGVASPTSPVVVGQAVQRAGGW